MSTYSQIQMKAKATKIVISWSLLGAMFCLFSSDQLRCTNAKCCFVSRTCVGPPPVTLLAWRMLAPCATPRGAALWSKTTAYPQPSPLLMSLVSPATTIHCSIHIKRVLWFSKWVQGTPRGAPLVCVSLVVLDGKKFGNHCYNFSLSEHICIIIDKSIHPFM